MTACEWRSAGPLLGRVVCRSQYSYDNRSLCFFYISQNDRSYSIQYLYSSARENSAKARGGGERAPEEATRLRTVCKLAEGGALKNAPPGAASPAPPAPYLRNGNPIKSTQSVPRETKSETVKGDSRRDDDARRVALCARAGPAPHPAPAPRQPLLHVRPLQRAPCRLSFHFYIAMPAIVT